VIDGVMREAAGRSVEDLAQDENRVMIGLLKLRDAGSTKPASDKKQGSTKYVRNNLPVSQAHNPAR
jgi:hypothetical protein